MSDEEADIPHEASRLNGYPLATVPYIHSRTNELSPYYVLVAFFSEVTDVDVRPFRLHRATSCRGDGRDVGVVEKVSGRSESSSETWSIEPGRRRS